MKSLVKIAAGLAGLFFATTLALADVGIGQPFPKLGDFDLIGRLPYHTERVVLVDFWASWCAPCRTSFAAYNKLQEEFKDRGLTVIGVSVDQNENAYLSFLQRYNPGFATARDSLQKLVSTVRPPAMPTCYLIDRHGILRFVHRGFHGGSTTRQLREEITKLLDEKS